MRRLLSFRSLLRVCSLSAKGRSRSFSAPFAPSLRPCRLSWGGLVSPTPPPLQPPCKTPFRAAIRLILWGWLIWGKPIFAAAILPCSTPAAAVSGRAFVWLHGASARSGIRRRRASGRASRIDNHPKGAICALERHEKFSDTTPRQGCEAPRSGMPLTRFITSEIMTHREGSDRRERHSLAIPVRNCRLLFHGMNCIIKQRR